MTLPKTYRKMVVTTLTTDFRKAIEIQTCKMPKLDANTVLVRNRYVGINASDINFTAGRYTPGVPPPFDIGFEAVGEVVDAGADCRDMIGTAVAHTSRGAFAEYQKVSPAKMFKLPEVKPEYLAFLVSGMTAKLAFDINAQLKAGETVLVTAAAGGTGQFAVQLAKLAGCKVIGTCSTDKKVAFLKSVGCDKVINISNEDLKSVLKSEYADGVDVVYESVGGETFDTCVDALNKGGRLIVIGNISGYKENKPVGGTSERSMALLPMKLLRQSASVNGFFLLNHPTMWVNAFHKLSALYSSGKLKSFVDQGQFRAEGKMEGIEAISDAVDYMYSRKSIGKVFVDLLPVKNTQF